MKTKKIKVLTDMKKITVENSRAKAEKLAIEIKRKYSDLPKAYRNYVSSTFGRRLRS